MMTITRNAVLVVLVGIFFLASPLPTLAQLNFDVIKDVATSGGLSTSEPRPLIVSVITTILGFVGIIAVAVIIYGGVLYITSAGDESRAEKAKKLVLYAVIGLLLIGAAALIVNVVISVFKGGT